MSGPRQRGRVRYPLQEVLLLLCLLAVLAGAEAFVDIARCGETSRRADHTDSCVANTVAGRRHELALGLEPRDGDTIDRFARVALDALEWARPLR